MNQSPPLIAANLFVMAAAIGLLIFRRRVARSLVRSEELDPFKLKTTKRPQRFYELITVVAATGSFTISTLVFIQSS